MQIKSLRLILMQQKHTFIFNNFIFQVGFNAVRRLFRPPPPIQMYSIEDTSDNIPDHRGPIYDTINDGDDSGHSSYSRSNGSSSDNNVVPGVPVLTAGFYPRSTFGGGPLHNGGYVAGDYDVPEGEDHHHNHRQPLQQRSSVGVAVGTVTINGIAV